MPAKQREERSGPKPASERTDAAARADRNGAAGATTGSQVMIDLDFLRGLIEAIDQSGIDSLELQRAGTRIRISKSPAATVVTTSAAPAFAAAQPQTPMAPAPAPGGEARSHAESAVGSGSTAAPAPAASNLVEVKSPMVGTFYRAPAPEAPPYVEVGSHVTKGQTLCILEAMKLMNELEAEVDGVVREILVDNADPIEYGQVLFRIDPAGGRS
jgi:acetyl-CoA carboxylase biotin carboxyl carrier protein